MAVLPQALAQWQDPYEASRAALRAAMQQQQTPMYSDEEVAQRRAQNEREYQLGVLGQLSGNEQLGGVGATVLKRALAQRDPRVTERGVTDPLSGKFTYSPEYLNQRNEQQLAQLDAKSAAARSAYDAERRGFADKEELQRQRFEDMKELRRIGAAQGQVGAFQPAGFTPDGKQVVTNSKSGVNYTLTLNPDGTPNYTPYGGVFTPKASFEKDVAAAGEVDTSLGGAKRLLGVVEKNPSAFGLRGRLVNATPPWGKDVAASMLRLTPEEREAQSALMRDAAMQIKELYGAALSMGEQVRADTFLARSDDDFGTLLAKLRGAVAWGEAAERKYGPAVWQAVRQRRGEGGGGGSWDAPAQAPGGPQAPANPGAGGLTPAEAEELRQLRARYPGGAR